MQQNRIILASASPRRWELMTQAGFEFEVQVSHKEEHYDSDKPEEIVKELALLKAEDIATQNEGKNLTVIGADTIVAVDDKILGKPKDKADALSMVRAMQGRSHQVYTGVAIIRFDSEGKKEVVSHAVCTDVVVYPMSEEEMLAYVEDDSIMDKAGAYAIQGEFGAKYIKRFEGDYYNVVGLPISYIYQVLKKSAKQ